MSGSLFEKNATSHTRSDDCHDQRQGPEPGRALPAKSQAIILLLDNFVQNIAQILPFQGSSISHKYTPRLPKSLGLEVLGPQNPIQKTFHLSRFRRPGPMPPEKVFYKVGPYDRYKWSYNFITPLNSLINGFCYDYSPTFSLGGPSLFHTLAPKKIQIRLRQKPSHQRHLLEFGILS